MKDTTRGFAAVLAVLVMLIGAGSARATTYTWSGGALDGDWNDTGNWDALPVSGGGHTLVFNANPQGWTANNDLVDPFSLNVATFGTSMTFSGGVIEFAGTTPAANFAAGITLTFNCGLKISTANTTFRSSIAAANTSTIIFNGQLTGGQTLRYANNSPATTAPNPTFRFAYAGGANAINGFTMGDINAGRGAGKVQIAMDDPFGGAGTTLWLNNAGNVTVEGLTTARTIASGITQRGNLTFTGKSLTFNGNFVTETGGGRTLTCSLDAGETLTLAGGAGATFNGSRNTLQGAGTISIPGVLSDGTSGYIWAKSGTGTLRLTGANTYASQTQVPSGTLEFNSVENKSATPVACALGKPVANGTVEVIKLGLTSATTLKYIGTLPAGHSSDRPIDLAGTTVGVTLDASGVGPLSFTGGVTAGGVGAKTLTLQGASTGLNTIGGGIADSSGGATALLKDGTGTWRLTGTCGYMGATTVKAGTLLVDGALNAATTVTVQNGGRLGGAGMLNGALVVDGGGTVAPGTSVETLTVNLTGAATAAFAGGAKLAFDLAAPGAGDVLAFTGLSAGVADVTFNGNAIDFSNAGGLAEGLYTLCTFDAASAFSGAPTIGTGLEAYPASAIIVNASSIQLAVQVSAGDTEAPTVPQNVAATALSSTSIRVAWDASSDNVAVVGYKVYRDTVLMDTVTGTSFTDGGLTADTLYSYTVSAIDLAPNESAPSAPATARTFVLDTEAPTVPQNVTATAQSVSAILVTWDASTDNVGVTGYRVYRDAALVATVGSASHTDAGLAGDTLYAYTVTAIDAVPNESAPSAPAATARTLMPPTGPWNGAHASGSWSMGGSGGNWSGGAAPVSSTANDLVFQSNDSGQIANNDIADPFDVNTLTFNVAGLTLAGGAIRFNTAAATKLTLGANAVTFNNALELAQDVLLSTTTANPVTFNGQLRGPGKLIYVNAGTSAGTRFRFAAGATSTINGFTLGNATPDKGQATIQIAMDDPFGGAGTTLHLNNAGSVAIEGVTTARTIASGITQRGHLTFTGKSMAFNGNFSTDTGGGRTLTCSLDADETLTLAGGAGATFNGSRNTLQGAGTLSIPGVLSDGSAGYAWLKGGTGTLRLTGANTYASQTRVPSGTLEFNSVENKSATPLASALGQPVANGTVEVIKLGLTSATTLKYIGTLPAGHGSDRPLDLAGTTAGVTLDASGVGPISFTGGVMATGLGNKTLTLQGANTGFNTLGGVIEDSTGFKTALVKDGAGVWRLTGTSTFTGATTVKAGTLLVNGALDAGSAVTVEGGGTLGGTGALNGSLAVQSGGVVAPGAGGIGVLTVNLAGAATAGFAADASFAFELGVPGHGDVLAFAGLSAGVAAVTFNGNKVNFTATDPLAEGIHTLCTFDQNAAYAGTLSVGTGLETFSGATLSYKADRIEIEVMSKLPPKGTLFLMH